MTKKGIINLNPISIIHSNTSNPVFTDLANARLINNKGTVYNQLKHVSTISNNISNSDELIREINYFFNNTF